MANATKIALANWTKMVVATGGVGDIGLGAVNGYPPIGETLGTNKSFHYVIRAVNNTPLEAGVGVMTDVITLRRDNVYAKMLNGVYSAGDGLTNLSIPVGAFLYTADTKEMLEDLQLELPLRDYGNVSGATGVDLRNSAIKLNLTANATLTFSEPPPVGVKAEITLHATSANAGTADIGKGYMLTLPAACKLGKNSCPPIPLTHDSETVITLTTINGGTSYEVDWQQADANILDLGNVTGSINLDIRYLQSKANLNAASGTTLTIAAVSPAAKLGETAHYVIKNSSDGFRFIQFNPAIFTLVGSTLSQITVPLGYKADFSIRKNPHANDADAAYDVWVNGINYDVTGSGLSTTWNPSDYASSNLTLNNNNLTLEMTTGPTGVFSNANGRSARSFGGKGSGKWLYGVLVESLQSGTSGNGGYFGAGISTPANAVNSFAGLNVNSGCFMLMFEAGTRYIRTYDKNVLTTRAVITPAVGDIIVIALDADTGRGWVNYNGSWLYGGNPETGANPIFTLGIPNVFFPMNSFCELGTGNAGRYTILNELQVLPVLSTVPSYNYWTA